MSIIETNNNYFFIENNSHIEIVASFLLMLKHKMKETTWKQ